MPSRIIDCRLTPPTLPALKLKRSGFGDWLLKRLDEPGQIAAVFAPAGYAKTSLLRSLHAELLARSRRVVWLSLGVEADPPAQLGAYLAAALAQAGIALKLAADGDVLPDLVNALARVAEPLHLLIDNVEQIKHPDSLALLDRLLASLPPGTRAVLAGRHNPGLKLAALLAERRLILADPAELAFSFAETTEFLIRETGESLGAAALNDLHERTQGWPGLLSVLVASLARGESLETVLREGRLPQRELSAYIAEEILGELPEPDRLAIEVLALAPQVEQPMMAAVIDGRSCPDLDQIARRNPLVRAHGRGGFTVHPAVRRCLRAQLEAEDRPRYTSLCRRLADWYRQHGDAALAIDYLIDAGEPAQASALLEAEGRNIALEGFPDRCVSWLTRLHPEPLERHPGLQLTEVWARVTMHETRAASALLNSARLRAATRRNATINTEVMTAMAFSHAISDRADAALAAVEAVPQEARELSPIVRAGCASVEAWCLFAQGRFDAARGLLYRSASLEMHGQGLLTHAYAAIVSGECYAAEGKIGSAEAIFRRAVKLAEDLRGRRSMVVVVALGPLLEILYEADRVDEVLALASGRSHLRLKYSTPGSTSAAGVALAHSLMLRNAGPEAFELLDDMLLVGEESHLPRIVAHALAARIQLALREGRSHEIPELAGRLDALRNDSAGLLDTSQGVINFLSRLAQIRILASRGERLAARQAAASLAAAIAASPWTRVQVAVEALRVELAWHSGESADAVARLAALVQRCAPLGLVRSLVDQFSDITLLDAPELRRAVALPLHPYLDRLKAAMSTSLPVPQPGQRMIAPGSGWTDVTLAGQEPGFTAREREILFLVARGLSTKRIAQTLRVSPETAKWHTRNIYEKLGVHDRPAAQLAIRRLQIAGGAEPQPR